MGNEVLELLQQWLERAPDDPFFFDEDSKGTFAERLVWQPRTWGQLGEDVANLRRSFVALNLHRGDRVGYAGGASYGRLVVALAALGSDLALAIWPEHMPSRQDALRIFTALSVRVCFVDCLPTWSSIHGGSRIERPLPFPFVLLSNTRSDPRGYHSRYDFVALGRNTELAPLPSQETSPSASPALIMFSPGTAGSVRPLAFSLTGLMWTARRFVKALGLGLKDQYLEVLAPQHVGNFVLGVLGPLIAGFSVWAPSNGCVGWLAIRDVQPTLLVASADFWAMLYGAASNAASDAKVERSTALQQELLLHSIGCSRVRRAVSGGAPCPVDVLRYFSRLGVEVLEVYGQMETMGLTTLSRPGKAVFGTMGRAPAVEIEVTLLEPSMEVLVRGPNLFLGIVELDECAAAESEPCAWGVPAKAASHPLQVRCPTDPDGWFHSGDAGSVSDDGLLCVAGRLDDAIVLEKSDARLYPLQAETQLRSLPLIRQAAVIGHGREFLTALLSVDPTICRQQAAIRQLSDEEYVTSSEVMALLRRRIEAVNATLPTPIRRFMVTVRSLSLNSFSCSVPRSYVATAFSEEIAALYHQDLSPAVGGAGEKAKLGVPVHVEFVNTRSQIRVRFGRVTDGYYYLKKLDYSDSSKLYMRTEFTQEAVEQLEAHMVENMHSIRALVHSLQRLQEEVHTNDTQIEIVQAEIQKLKQDAAGGVMADLSKARSNASLLDKDVRKKEKDKDRDRRSSRTGKSHGELPVKKSK